MFRAKRRQRRVFTKNLTFSQGFLVNPTGITVTEVVLQANILIGPLADRMVKKLTIHGMRIYTDLAIAGSASGQAGEYLDLRECCFVAETGSNAASQWNVVSFLNSNEWSSTASGSDWPDKIFYRRSTYMPNENFRHTTADANAAWLPIRTRVKRNLTMDDSLVWHHEGAGVGPGSTPIAASQLVAVAGLVAVSYSVTT